MGIAATQLGKKLGLHVIGTAGTAEGIDLVKQNGADQVFNHNDMENVQQIKVHFSVLVFSFVLILKVQYYYETNLLSECLIAINCVSEYIIHSESGESADRFDPGELGGRKPS